MNEPQNPRHGREDESPSERTLTVRVASTETAFNELEEHFAALDAGEESESLYEVVLQREEDLTRLLRPGMIELLQIIARERPESIRETARLLNRDVHQIYDTVTELTHLNLLRLEEEVRRKRPAVWYDDLEIELSIGTGAEPAVSA